GRRRHRGVPRASRGGRVRARGRRADARAAAAARARRRSTVRARGRDRRDRLRAHARALDPRGGLRRDPGPRRGGGRRRDMSAEAHLEVYRPFQGTLREHPVRFVPLWTSGLRTALKQRRALLLYLPAVIATAIVSFIVYGKYATGVSGVEPPSGGGLQ